MVPGGIQGGVPRTLLPDSSPSKTYREMVPDCSGALRMHGSDWAQVSSYGSGKELSSARADLGLPFSRALNNCLVFTTIPGPMTISCQGSKRRTRS